MDNPPQPKVLKVVIVEDNGPLADIYKTRLELIGYECHVAYDGVAALEVIEREHPDLVLLDLMVPKIAGDQILERMRQSEWGKDIRVFVISNLNEVDAPKGLRELGIEGYVVKANLANDQLDQLVDNILKPQGQTVSTSLENQTIIPHDDVPPPPAQNPTPIAVEQPPPLAPEPETSNPAEPEPAPTSEPTKSEPADFNQQSL